MSLPEIQPTVRRKKKIRHQPRGKASVNIEAEGVVLRVKREKAAQLVNKGAAEYVPRSRWRAFREAMAAKKQG